LDGICACVKHEEIRNCDVQSHREYVEVFEGGSIDAPLDQTQEVHRNVEQFGELLLAHLPGQSNRLQAIPEFFAKTRHLIHRFGGESGLEVCFVPPNEITGKRTVAWNGVGWSGPKRDLGPVRLGPVLGELIVEPLTDSTLAWVRHIDGA
jgi:hypothetical protein